nr:hypothetical protein [Desulfitobacterium hafniense]
KADPESKGKVESVVKFIKINFLENRFYMGLDLLNQSFVMNTEGLILETLKGLLATSTEKVCVLGVEDAQDDLKRLREVYEDLVLFWGLDEDLLDAFDEKIGLVK